MKNDIWDSWLDGKPLECKNLSDLVWRESDQEPNFLDTSKEWRVKSDD